MGRYAVWLVVCVWAAVSAVGQALAQSPTRTTANLEALNRRAAELVRAGEYHRAAQVAEQVSAAARTRYGTRHPAYAAAIRRQGEVLTAEGRYGEAEPLLRDSVEIYQTLYGAGDRRLVLSLVYLAQLLRRTHHIDEAETLLRRAIEIQEKDPKPSDERLSSTFNILANVLRQRSNPAEAETMYRRSLELCEKANGPDHPRVATRLNNLALLLMATHRVAEAEAPLRRALAITEKAYGPEHPVVAIRLNGMARLMQATKRPGEAEKLLERSLSIVEKSYGSQHIKLGNALMALAASHAERDDWTGAAELGRRAMPILTGHGQETAANTPATEHSEEAGEESGEEQDAAAPTRDQLADRTNLFRLYAHVLYRAGTDNERTRSQAFEVAQWAIHSDAADALAQMSLRFASGAGQLGELVRERQDLTARRRADDNRLLAAIAGDSASVAQQLRTSLAMLDVQLDRIDARLANEFKEYAELSKPLPMELPAVQSMLQPSEALVLLLDVRALRTLKELTLVFVVTKDRVAWFTSKRGTRSLAQTIAALRCGLDPSLWTGGKDQDRCIELLHHDAFDENVDGQATRTLPFDLQRAYHLYRDLLAPADGLIAGKQLLVVPSGPLAALPFGVLVTEPPSTQIPQTVADYRQAAWLGIRQPITVIPSVTSLKALRLFATASRANTSYLGIGNPLLNGQQRDRQWGDYFKQQALAARDKRCSDKPARLAAAEVRGPRSIGNADPIMAGDHADIEFIRELIPLPETADELCEIGRRLGVPQSQILLGGQATETNLKDLSNTGRLKEYSIVHFATHGALAGQARGIGEPGLVLTPPASGTTDSKALDRDDGFLTASEIATLKFDAQWVILSACNSAGAAEGTHEPLSGLARAFFYAGTRALLVSHWAVDSAAAVELTTQAFAELSSDQSIGRSEALRRSMRNLVTGGTHRADAHPSVWAPFVVVGEGSLR